eukprot:gene24644-29976_t
MKKITAKQKEAWTDNRSIEEYRIVKSRKSVAHPAKKRRGCEVVPGLAERRWNAAGVKALHVVSWLAVNAPNLTHVAIVPDSLYVRCAELLAAVVASTKSEGKAAAGSAAYTIGKSGSLVVRAEPAFQVGRANQRHSLRAHDTPLGTLQGPLEMLSHLPEAEAASPRGQLSPLPTCECSAVLVDPAGGCPSGWVACTSAEPSAHFEALQKMPGSKMAVARALVVAVQRAWRLLVGAPLPSLTRAVATRAHHEADLPGETSFLLS